MNKVFNKLNSNKNKANNSTIKNINNVTTKNVSIEKIIQSYLLCIDNKDKTELEILYNRNHKDNVEEDIVYKMYKKNELNSERFQFIIENCTSYLNISSSLIKKLMKNNKKELLEILFKNHLKFFDKNFILNLLKYYKDKTPTSNSELYPFINKQHNEK